VAVSLGYRYCTGKKTEIVCQQSRLLLCMSIPIPDSVTDHVDQELFLFDIFTSLNYSKPPFPYFHQSQEAISSLKNTLEQQLTSCANAAIGKHLESGVLCVYKLPSQQFKRVLVFAALAEMKFTKLSCYRRRWSRPSPSLLTFRA
jgi:hypothetical protein